MRLFALAPCLALLACGSPRPQLGGVELSAEKDTFTATDTETKKALLEAFTAGAGAYAPAAVRTAKSRVELQYGSFKFTDGPGAWTEARRFQWDEVKAGRSKGSWRDAQGKAVVMLEATEAGAGELKLEWRAVEPATNRLSLAFRCAAPDHFLGFGGQADGVDHKGHTVPIWTSEPGIGKQMEDDEYPDLWFLVGTRHASSYGLPTWLSSRGYLGVAETDRRSVFELCSVQEDAWRVEVWGNAFTLWVFAGAPSASLEAATGRVLGRPMRPPPIAFAPWSEALFGSAVVRGEAAALRDAGVPSSVIWTEDFRGGNWQSGSYRLVEDWDLDRSLYPDAEAVAAELEAQGFGWLAYYNTFLEEGSRAYAEAGAGGHFVKNAAGAPYLFTGATFKPMGLADLSRPETREWVKSHLRKSLDVGFTGWMADFGEWLPHDAVLASGEDPLEAHNRYAREWVQLNDEVLKERASDGRQRVFFARAGWLRSNQHTPVAWAGDQRTSFQLDDGLFTVIPMGINLGLAGVSTYAHDIGGYQSATNPPATKELFFRWTSLGALSPVMRTHHGTQPQLQWRWDKDAETVAHFKRWAQLHVQLFPYLDAHSAEAEATGVPIVRSLALHYPTEERAWTTADEYLLGGGMLVAPVYTEGATSRTVWLPPGEWVLLDGAGDTRFPAGPATEDVVQAPVGELPVFLRAGVVVPLLPARVQTLQRGVPGVEDLDDVKDERRLWLVTGANGGFRERDGTLYVVQQADTTRYAQDGVELPACSVLATRGCVDAAGPRVVVRMRGPGVLEVPGHTLTVDGPVRTYDVEVIRPTKTRSR